MDMVTRRDSLLAAGREGPPVDSGVARQHQQESISQTLNHLLLHAPDEGETVGQNLTTHFHFWNKKLLTLTQKRLRAITWLYNQFLS